MTVRRLLASIAAPVLAVSLTACISVLPKSKPDQLYSFGHAPIASPAQSAGMSAAGVLLSAVDFPRAAEGDQILTVAGTRSAYIAESRWAGPASVLFREAVERAFDAGARATRLVARGETGRTALILRVEVRDFEAVYANGLGAAPTVTVSLRARLTRPDGRVVDERVFDARIPAADDRVGPIVEAFDRATSQTLTALVAWTDQTAAALPPASPNGAALPVVTSTSRSTTTTTTASPPAR